MRTQRGGDIRESERRPFHGAVQISWPTPAGEMRTIRAKCLDLSDKGARIECEQPIEFRTNVYLQAPAHGLMGNASVRYCRRSGLRHIIGLMFSAAVNEAEEGRKRLIKDTRGAER